jgi:hypothetical protein
MLRTGAESKGPRPATPDELLGVVKAYSIFSAARWEARIGRLPVYEGAMALARLRELDIPDAILTWMMYQAHIDHLLPTCRESGRQGKPQPVASLQFGQASAFVLTDAGADFANGFLADVLVPEEDSFDRAWEGLLLRPLLPSYDREGRVFCWGRHVIKWFRQPSFNQEVVLRAGEAQGWPSWFDVSLVRRKGRNLKVCLHDTLKDLNRRQAFPLIHFKGDGSGTRVGWDFL